MTTTVETIEAAMMPPVQHPALRSRPQKERSSAIRKLLRQVKIKNVSVTSDHGSMCFGTSVRFVPLACPERGPDHGSWNCPICKRNTEAEKRLREIILAAFPDMDDRSDSMTDYFDQPFSVHADWSADGEVETSKAAEPAHEEESPRYEPTSSQVIKPIDRPAFLNSNEIAKACDDVVKFDREHAVVFFLDVRNRIIGERWTAAIGSVTGVEFSPREVYREALLRNAVAIVLAHNHPSGDPSPSRQDIELTSRFRSSGETLGVRLLDHVIVATAGFVSLAMRGAL